MIATVPLLRYSWHNMYARPAVLQGWGPILLAMMISSAVGVIMSKVAEKYSGLMGFLPIINGECVWNQSFVKLRCGLPQNQPHISDAGLPKQRIRKKTPSQIPNMFPKLLLFHQVLVETLFPTPDRIHGP